MRRRDRIIFELDQKELRLLRDAMLAYRNRTAERGKPTEDIDLILSKLYV